MTSQIDAELERAEKDGKPILSVKFDGVVYSSGVGLVPDVLPEPPVDGAFKFLAEAAQTFTVCLWSTRTREAGGRYAICRWLKRHGWPMAPDGKPESLYIPEHKPACFLSIDDKCFLFRGEFPGPADLTKFRSYREGKLSSTA